MKKSEYRGRIAPSPTGYLHLGHASTFKIAHERARERNGTLIFRNEDLDPLRCKPEYSQAIIQDLASLSISWDEGPINQSERLHLYLEIWNKLKDTGNIYPCSFSRKMIQSYTTVNNDDEQLFPKELRPKQINTENHLTPSNYNWRFKVPDGRKIQFIDEHYGPQEFEAGKDFGDFLVWRKEGIPSYELAVVTDDHLMGITEVVRGADLLKSTARQLLIYESLEWPTPKFYHCDLICDENGNRLAKRNGSSRVTS